MDRVDPRSRTGTPFGFRRVAEQATLERPSPRPAAALGVLLLPTRLEELDVRGHAEDLLAAPGVLAVEPARLPARALPGVVADALAGVQARRLRLPGVPAAVLVYHPGEYPLARALIARHPDAQLWYRGWEEAGEPSAGRRARLAELDDHCRFRADHAFAVDAAAPDPHAANRPLWERLEALGVESGRLGSERADVLAPVRRR